MRPCNRCIKYNLKYFILKQFKFCAEYLSANCVFYLLIIIKADWRRVRAKKRNFKRALTSQEKKYPRRLPE